MASLSTDSIIAVDSIEQINISTTQILRMYQEYFMLSLFSVVHTISQILSEIVIKTDHTSKSQDKFIKKCNLIRKVGS